MGIRAHLYHYLWLNRRRDRIIKTEYQIDEVKKGRRERIDFAILDSKKIPKLLIEVTESVRKRPKRVCKTIREKLERDIKKLRSARNNKSRQAKLFIVFFFRKCEQNINLDVEKEIGEIKGKNPDIEFRWHGLIELNSAKKVRVVN